MESPSDVTRIEVTLGTREHPVLIHWARWRVREDRPASAYHSYAAMTGDGPVLIDPVDPTGDQALDLWALVGDSPVAAMLTNDMHERDAYRIRDRHGTPVWAPLAGLPRHGGVLAGVPSATYTDGDTLPGGLRAFKLDGRFSGDSAILWPAPDGPGLLFTGDALNGPESDPRLPSPIPHPRAAPGLYLGAGQPYLRHPNPAALKRSLRRLLGEDFDVICGAHGRPVGRNAHDALRRLLALDWAPLLARQQFPRVDL